VQPWQGPSRLENPNYEYTITVLLCTPAHFVAILILYGHYIVNLTLEFSQFTCPLCETKKDTLGHVPVSQLERPAVHTMANMMSLRKEAIENGRWPGCEQDQQFSSPGNPFVPTIFWDGKKDTVIIQSRREAAEQALGFRLNDNFFYSLKQHGFDMCMQVPGSNHAATYGDTLLNPVHNLVKSPSFYAHRFVLIQCMSLGDYGTTFWVPCGLK